MNTWVLGDVHGQYGALLQVFARAGLNYKKDRLIFLGDIMDRGNEPFACMAALLQVENRILIQGNHDAEFARYLTPRVDQHAVLINATTRRQWITADEAIKEQAIHFLSLQVPYFLDEYNRCFTHGGFVPGSSLQDQPQETFLYNRTLWKEALRCHPDRLATKEGFAEIYIGHTPTLMFGTTAPMYKAGIWNLDTGAGYTGGRLTMMNLTTKAAVQSDPVNTNR